MIAAVLLIWLGAGILGAGVFCFIATRLTPRPGDLVDRQIAIATALLGANLATIGARLWP